MSDWKLVEEFENKVAEYFGSHYAVAVDSCTHGIELCLRFTKARKIICPKHTYISIPFLASKIGIDLLWKDDNWKEYYLLTDSSVKMIFDAAVMFKRNSYIAGTFMSISFQYQKHLSLGRGGMILCDSKEAAEQLKKMSYDGRLPGIPWRDQNIDTMGYHYYMTPETAELGLNKLPKAIMTQPRKWTVTDWPDLTQMEVFNK